MDSHGKTLLEIHHWKLIGEIIDVCFMSLNKTEQPAVVATNISIFITLTEEALVLLKMVQSTGMQRMHITFLTYVKVMDHITLDSKRTLRQIISIPPFFIETFLLT